MKRPDFLSSSQNDVLCQMIHKQHKVASFFAANIPEVKDITRGNLEKNKHDIQNWKIYLILH